MNKTKVEDSEKLTPVEVKKSKAWLGFTHIIRPLMEIIGLFAFYFQMISVRRVYESGFIRNSLYIVLIFVFILIILTARSRIKKALKDFEVELEYKRQIDGYEDENSSLKTELEENKICLTKEISNKEKEINLLRNILNNINNVRGSNFIHLNTHIEKRIKTKNFMEIITNPQERLVAMANDILDRVLELFEKKDRDDVIMSFVYNYPENKPFEERRWDTIIRWPINDDMNELIMNKRTTFYSVLVGTPYAFHNVKMDALTNMNIDVENIPNDANRYHKAKSESSDLPGSIVCQYIFVGDKNNKYIEALFSISTNKFPFIQEDNIGRQDRLRHMLSDYIFGTYAAKIRHELACFYMQNKRAKKLNPPFLVQNKQKSVIDSVFGRFGSTLPRKKKGKGAK